MEQDDLITEYAETKAEIERQHRKLAGITQDLIGLMEAKGRKTVRTSRDGYVLQATYTQQTTVKIDESGLRKRLGAPVFDKYTRRVLDRKKLEEALETGDVDRVAVSPFVTVRKSEPFLKFTTKEDNRERAEDAEV